MTDVFSCHAASQSGARQGNEPQGECLGKETQGECLGKETQGAGEKGVAYGSGAQPCRPGQPRQSWQPGQPGELGQPRQQGQARGRLAPSPTGRLHLGNAFAFLCAWLDIRARRGSLVLRIEDIDPERSKPEYERGIIEDLSWLGLDWDEGVERGPFAPYRQSERHEAYAASFAALFEKGVVYPCYCTRKELRMLASAPHIGDEGAPYPGTCRALGPICDAEEPCPRPGTGHVGNKRAALRVNIDAALAHLPAANPSPYAFTDAVQGKLEFSPESCGGDFAIRRSDGVVAYQLAVAADDAAMGITHVVRGDDLLLSTPRQRLLFMLFGKSAPQYAHVPLVHDAKGERLAKRHAALELAALRGGGVRPQAVIGYLAYLAGWIPQACPLSPEALLPVFSAVSSGPDGPDRLDGPDGPDRLDGPDRPGRPLEQYGQSGLRSLCGKQLQIREDVVPLLAALS